MESTSPRVIYDSKHLLGLLKPFGMPSQPDPSGDESLLQWAQDHSPGEMHLLHRLDRPTGGIVLLAKTSKAAAALSRQFQERTVKKTYLAVVEGDCPEESLDLQHYLAKLPGKNFVRAYDKPVRGSKPAHLRAAVRARAEGLALLELDLLTGRRHQIRAQLQRLKLWILGDHKYGKSKRVVDFPGIALWAHTLSFMELDGTQQELRVEPPTVKPWNLFES